jgi:hypothetical protein
MKKLETIVKKNREEFADIEEAYVYTNNLNCRKKIGVLGPRLSKKLARVTELLCWASINLAKELVQITLS